MLLDAKYALLIMVAFIIATLMIIMVAYNTYYEKPIITQDPTQESIK